MDYVGSRSHWSPCSVDGLAFYHNKINFISGSFCLPYSRLEEGMVVTPGGSVDITCDLELCTGRNTIKSKIPKYLVWYFVDSTGEHAMISLKRSGNTGSYGVRNRSMSKTLPPANVVGFNNTKSVATLQINKVSKNATFGCKITSAEIDCTANQDTHVRIKGELFCN